MLRGVIIVDGINCAVTYIAVSDDFRGWGLVRGIGGSIPMIRRTES